MLAEKRLRSLLQNLRISQHIWDTLTNVLPLRPTLAVLRNYCETKETSGESAGLNTREESRREERHWLREG